MAPTEGSRRPDWGELLAVAGVSMTGLATEVALTRAFSVLLRFDYVFLAVSLATCGLGLGGLVDHLLRRLRPAPVMGVAAMACAVAGPLGISALFVTPLSADLTSIWVLAACCLPGFVAGGVFLSRAFTIWAKHGGLLYFADLTGAALAAGGVILLLQYGGAVNAAFLGASIAAFGGALVWRRLPATALAVALGGALAFTGLANRTERWVDLPTMRLTADPQAKPLYQNLGNPASGAHLIYSRWDAFARTDVVVYAGPNGRVAPGSDLYLYTDGEVPTDIMYWDGHLSDIQRRCQHIIGYYAFRQLMPKKTLLIGPGGGLDIWLAILVGCPQIDGAEVNPATPQIVHHFEHYGGPIYDYKGVNIRVAEGRSFVRRSRQRYDLIYMALAKTATTATASMALVDGYLYTVQACRDYYAHLSDRGAMAYVCQSPWLLLREMLTCVKALESEGETRQQALDSVCMLSVPREYDFVGPDRHLLLMFRHPQSMARWRDLARKAVGAGYIPAYFPGCYEPKPLDVLRDPKIGMTRFVHVADNYWNGDAEGPDFAPCTDDRPFYEDMSFGVPPNLGSFLADMVVLLLVILVLAPAAAGELRRPARRLSWLIYFAALGVAFMLVEVVMIQTFTLYLGYPVLSLATLIFGLLLGAGIGSRLSQRIPERRLAGGVVVALVGLVAFATLLLAVLPAVFGATLAWDVRLRSAITLLAVVPLGMLMGVPFPSGIRLVTGEAGVGGVPWLWAINGVASVVGSAGAMALAKVVGFRWTILVGLAVYLLAALVVVAARGVRRATGA